MKDESGRASEWLKTTTLGFTAAVPAGIVRFPAEKLKCRRGVNAVKQNKTMGDKSPKSNQKKSSQKQAVTNSADQKKKQDLAAKQGVAKKK